MQFCSSNILFNDSLLRRCLLYLVAFLVLFSFGIHIIHMNHHHEAVVYGTGFEAVMHKADRKWLFAFVIISLATLLLSAEIRNLQRYKRICKKLRSQIVIARSLMIPKLFGSLYEALRRGIVQPLVYG